VVRIHAALVAIVAAFGTNFVLDPCGGGGDLCLGGVVALASFAFAGIGIGSIATWWLGHRASPLLVWDSILVTLAGTTLASSMGGGAPIVIFGFSGVLLLGVPGAILSGQAVSRHKVERLLAIAALAATMLLGIGLIVVTIVGLASMAIGWFLRRSSDAPLPPTTTEGL
jgi:hypothetical protein